MGAASAAHESTPVCWLAVGWLVRWVRLDAGSGGNRMTREEETCKWAVCVCVRACARARVRVCVCACVRVCVRSFVRSFVRACV